jgi:hypothetical protein
LADGLGCGLVGQGSSHGLVLPLCA